MVSVLYCIVLYLQMFQKGTRLSQMVKQTVMQMMMKLLLTVMMNLRIILTITGKLVLTTIQMIWMLASYNGTSNESWQDDFIQTNQDSQLAQKQDLYKHDKGTGNSILGNPKQNNEDMFNVNIKVKFQR